MVTDLLDWKWSSYLAMVGGVSRSGWLETDWVLNHFGGSRESAVIHYENFVREGIGLSPIWDALKRQVFLGDEAFVDKAITRIEGAVGESDLTEVPRMQRRVQAKSLDWYMEHYSSRDEGIVSAYVTGDYLMKDIADKFKVHYSTVSRAIKKAEMLDYKT